MPKIPAAQVWGPLDLQHSYIKGQAYKKGDSSVIQSSGIDRARWKEIGKLHFSERPNLREYDRAQPRKTPDAMLQPLCAHTHACTCTHVCKYTHACTQTTHTCRNLPCFIHLSHFWCFSNITERESQLNRAAEDTDCTWPVSLMGLLPSPPEGERGMWERDWR